ncbi:uncharacterized protein LOC126703866 [Quercus robur]|uniref:uncharacterized protein LOC126703866 n=1 Tax=Quercus robur TaxID=38942 RepID=UPI0021639F62|nr:uncharacterized protein LOC126703866 [Quercus robur]
MEKLAFALVIAARRLKPYFQAHTIVVLTDKPLRKAMNSPKAVGRMALWAIELSEFDIQYRLRTAIKGQAVADFIAEFTLGEGQLVKGKEQWNIYTDGSSNKRVGGAEVVIQTPQGDKIQCMIRLDFPTTNNEVEYEALVTGLDLAKVAGAKNIIVHCDSQVVTSQINGDYECKNDRMKRYLEEVKYRISNLEVEFIQIPREENEWADHLAKAASAEFMLVPEQAGVLPEKKGAARKLKVQASQFVLIKDVLYKRGFSRPYLRCLCKEEADYVMREVHEGICGNHSGARSHVHKLIRAGYYWPTMMKDAQVYVQSCNKCQRYGIPRVLVSDNGKQFNNSAFRDFCSELGIKNHYLSPAHPQANGQVKVTSRSLLKIIKTRLEGAKAVIPAEVGLTSYRVESYDEDKNKEAIRLQLDLVDKVRAAAEQRLARYQNLMAKHYSNKVRRRDFQVRDLVLRKVMGAARDPSQGKFGPNWEGPYRITSWQRNGTYHLETMDGQKLQHPWNTEHLRKYYQ